MKNESLSSIINGLNICINKIILLKEYYSWINKNGSRVIEIFNQQENKMTIEVRTKFFNDVTTHIKSLDKAVNLGRNVLNEIIRDEDNLSVQYITLLNNELVNFNWQQLHYLDSYHIENLKKFEETLDEGLPFSGNDFNVINSLRYMVEGSTEIRNILIQKISSVNLFDRIGHIDTNIVIVGPNGSGKSTFARNLNGKIGSNFSIISAQHLLVYNSPTNLNLNQSSIEVVRRFQKFDKLGSDHNLTNLFMNDFSNLVLALFEEKAERERNYYDGKENRKESVLDSTILIWQKLITHREIVQSGRFELSVKTMDNETYHFNNLSDGEKAIFYYIGHVLLAEENCYIIVDEPENHLHLSICIKLWNMLEEIRNDCKFIYITHNLDFAVSRNRTTVLWNKNFTPPFDWEVEEISFNETIPDILLLEIMGSRRDVIFCEGDSRNSLDYKIYSRLFPNYNVIPVNGHDQVISYCKSFNSNRELSLLEAFGIIDGDAWTQEEIKSMKENNIMVLPFNEIENLICTQPIMEVILNIVGSHPGSFENYKEAFFDIVVNEKERFSTWYANNRINNYLKHNLFQQNKNIDELKREVETILVGDKIQGFYDEMLERVETDLASKDYDALIKYVNFKRRLTREMANKLIVNNYEDRFINLLSSNLAFEQFIKKEIVETHFPLLIESV